MLLKFKGWFWVSRFWMIWPLLLLVLTFSTADWWILGFYTNLQGLLLFSILCLFHFHVFGMKYHLSDLHVVSNLPSFKAGCKSHYLSLLNWFSNSIYVFFWASILCFINLLKISFFLLCSIVIFSLPILLVSISKDMVIVHFMYMCVCYFILFYFTREHLPCLFWSGPNFTQIDFAQNRPHVHCIFVSPWIREHFCVWALKPILLSRITCLCIVSYYSVCTNYYCSSLTYFMVI